MKVKTKPGTAEYDRFRELAKYLVAVPKKEIDQQKAKYERQKTAKTKPR